MKRIRLNRKKGLKPGRTKFRLSRLKGGRSYAEVKWMKAVRIKDDFTCQRCGKYDLYIHTHHIAPRSRRPDLRLVVSNGICLDDECHRWVHDNPREATEQGYLSDVPYERRAA